MTNSKLVALLVGAGITVAGSEAAAKQITLQDEVSFDNNVIQSLSHTTLNQENLVNGGCGNGGCGNGGCGNGGCGKK